MAHRDRKIAVEWFRGIHTTEEKEQVLSTIYSSIPVLLILRKVLKNKLALVRREQKADFDNPAWPYKQAKLLGKEEAYEELLQLLPEPDNE